MKGYYTSKSCYKFLASLDRKILHWLEYPKSLKIKQIYTFFVARLLVHTYIILFKSHISEHISIVNVFRTNNKCIQTEVPPFAQPQVEIDWKPSNQSIRLAPPAETDKLSVYSLQSGPMLSAHETFEWAPFDRQRYFFRQFILEHLGNFNLPATKCWR